MPTMSDVPHAHEAAAETPMVMEGFIKNSFVVGNLPVQGEKSG